LASTLNTSSAKFGSCRLRADTFTASFTSPALAVIMPTVAARSTSSVIGPIRSVCSATPMNSLGGIEPWSVLPADQRLHGVDRPSDMRNWGWKWMQLVVGGAVEVAQQTQAAVLWDLTQLS
jgi:hypothetical protein